VDARESFEKELQRKFTGFAFDELAEF